MTNRERFRNELQKRLQHEEETLEALGCRRRAWRVLRVAFDSAAELTRFMDKLVSGAYPRHQRRSGGVLFVFDLGRAAKLLGPFDEVIQEQASDFDPKERDWKRCSARIRRTATTPKWLAAQSAAVAAAALRMLDDPYVLALALQALENFRGLRETPLRDVVPLVGARRTGAAIANDRKRKNYRDRDADLYARYEALVQDGLKAMKSEKAARADAKKALASDPNVNVKPQRVGDIIRVQRSSASR